LVELPSEEAVQKLSARSVTMRRAIQLWADEPTVPRLHASLKEKCLNGLLEPYKSKSFKVDVDLFCNSQTQEEKLERIEVNRFKHFTFNLGGLMMLSCSTSRSVICHFKDTWILKIQMLYFNLLSITV
jgi:hypothetical protein